LSVSNKNKIYVGVISLTFARDDVIIFQNLILELKESVPVKILAINFRQFDGHFSDRTIHILKFEGQSKDNNCPLVLVWRTIGAEGMHEIEYCCRSLPGWRRHWEFRSRKRNC